MTETMPNNIDNGVGNQYSQNGDTQTEHMLYEEEGQRASFDPNNIRVSIKSTDMSENMVIIIVEKAIFAFQKATNKKETQKEGTKLDFNNLVSRFLKIQMEKFYKESNWQVIVGEDYGGFFTHEEFKSIVFCMNGKWITAFKSNVSVPDEDQI